MKAQEALTHDAKVAGFATAEEYIAWNVRALPEEIVRTALAGVLIGLARRGGFDAETVATALDSMKGWELEHILHSAGEE